MRYNIQFYSKKRAEERIRYYKRHTIFVKNKIDTNKTFFDFILWALDNPPGLKRKRILDLGTGTGYVPQVLCRLTNNNFNIVGVDLSENMLQSAKRETKDKRSQFLRADNNRLPFRDKSFDIVSNKLTTQFNIKEVYRVLKNGGYFIFKEYGKYKGFKEIAELFGDRYKRTDRTPIEYLDDLYESRFSDITLRIFLIERSYNLQEIKEIFGMSNLIKDFTHNDLIKIKNKLAIASGKIKITSDPFIICAKK